MSRLTASASDSEDDCLTFRGFEVKRAVQEVIQQSKNRSPTSKNISFVRYDGIPSDFMKRSDQLTNVKKQILRYKECQDSVRNKELFATDAAVYTFVDLLQGDCITTKETGYKECIEQVIEPGAAGVSVSMSQIVNFTHFGKAFSAVIRPSSLSFETADVRNNPLEYNYRESTAANSFLLPFKTQPTVRRESTSYFF